MAFQIKWVIEGDVELNSRLRILSDRMKNWEPAFKETAEALQEVFSQDVFATEGGAIEEAWAPLSPAYALRKARLYPGKGILEATGRMKNGFLTLWRPDMAVVWNEVEYFKYHQSNQPRSRLPRRVMMKLANKQQTLVVRIFNSYFQEAVNS